MRSRLASKRRIGQLYGSMRARDTQRKLILLYHSVGGGPEATGTERFRDHLNLIAATGNLRALRDLIASDPGPGLAVAITFDDGYATLRDRASAVLAEFGCPATVFLNVGEIAEDVRRSSRIENGYYPAEQFLTWPDVEALIAAGWQIGSHGVHHLDLVKADAATAENEFCASKAMLERRIGMPCDMFAYPWGRSTARLRAAVGAAGYRYGFSGYHSGLTPRSDPLALPRINVAKEYSRDDLAAILRGDWDYLAWVAKARAVAR
jgi:peptidoglycan/xylan/chitin deacetylase (PgdA/CDA1 family)